MLTVFFFSSGSIVVESSTLTTNSSRESLGVSGAGHTLAGVLIRGLWDSASSDKESVFGFGMGVGFTERLTQTERWEGKNSGRENKKRRKSLGHVTNVTFGNYSLFPVFCLDPSKE